MAVHQENDKAKCRCHMAATQEPNSSALVMALRSQTRNKWLNEVPVKKSKMTLAASFSGLRASMPCPTLNSAALPPLSHFGYGCLLA